MMAEVREEEEEGGIISNTNSSRWSDLQDDLLESICELLSLSDYLKIRAVCSNWRTKAKAMINLPSPPLLLHVKQHHRTFSFLNLSTQTSFHLQWPTFLNNNHFCHGSVQGWIIMTLLNPSSLSETHVFFYNPITHTTFNLPSLLHLNPTQISKIVASSPPTHPNCVLVCLHKDNHNFSFTRINSNDSSSWTLVKGDEELGINFMEVEIHKGKLYAMTDGTLNSILVYDLQEQPVLNFPTILAKLPPKSYPFRIIIDSGGRDFGYSVGKMYNYLASSEDRLLLVNVFHKGNLFHTTTMTCVVFELRMNNDGSNARWVKVEDLGDGLVFVGEYKSLVVSQSDFAAQKLDRKNCVYVATLIPWYCEVEDQMKEMILSICSLTDKGVSSSEGYFLPHNNSSTSQRNYLMPLPIWFTPSV